MATMVPNRRSTFGITCVQCHEELIAPDKSEYRAGTHIRTLRVDRANSNRGDDVRRHFSIRGRGVVRFDRGSVRKDAERA